MDDLRGVYSMSDAQMPEWEEICKKWAKDHNAKLLFVNHESFGVEINGNFSHIYIDELQEMLKKMKQRKPEKANERL